jgi:hypothetical protein
MLGGREGQRSNFILAKQFKENFLGHSCFHMTVLKLNMVKSTRHLVQCFLLVVSCYHGLYLNFGYQENSVN